MQMVKLLKLTSMMLSALRKTSMKMTQMLSVTVANIMMLNQVQYTLEQDTTIQVRVDLFQEILMQAS